MSLTPSNRNNPCPICEATSGNCRQGREDQNYWQCMIYADSRKGEIHNGYKCIGHTRDSLWAQFRLDNSQQWSEQQRQDWQRENQRRRNQQASENEQRRQRSLSAPQRHEQYTKLLSELTLHPDDRADLVRRGFTHEQIELAGFKSIGRYHQLQSQYSELLPGISRGNRLIIADQGYLCPVRNADGLIIACQVRLRSLPSTESARYRWLSGGGQTLHLYPEGCKPEGELPLPVFRPQGKPEGIALAEGTGAKPFLVSQRFNLFTIGAAGGQWPSSPELFRLILEKAEIEVKTKEIKILPDAGDILNPSVMTRWQRVIDLLEQWGWSVAIGWWGQTDKSHPDIDELTDYSQIEFIFPEEFLAKAKVKPTEAKATEEKKGFSEGYQEKAKEAWHAAKRFAADIQRSSQWCDWKLPPSNSIFFGRAGLGRGKTTRLRNWVRTWQEEGKGFITLGYRNTLLLQLCEKLGFYHLHESDSALMRHDPSGGIALCVDSLWRFRPEEFDDKILILDEVMSVIRHLLHSPTVKGRDNILDLFQEALQRASQVICLDGCMADWAVKYLHELAPGKKIIRAENTFSGDKPTVNFLVGTVDIEEEVRKNDRSPWLDYLLNDCAVPAVCIFMAEKIAPEFADELSKKFDARWEDRVKVIQASYRGRLPGIDETPSWTEDFIYKIRYDNPDFLTQQELFWMYSHPEEANRMNQERYHRIAQKERTFIGNIRSRMARVRALRAINFEQFLDPEKTWMEDSPELVELVEQCRDEKIAAALGRHPGQQSNIRFLGSLLKIVGLKHRGQKVKSEDGDYRVYRLDRETLSDPDRRNALQCLDRRWENYLKKEVEVLDWEPILNPTPESQQAETVGNIQCQQAGGSSQQVKSPQAQSGQGFDPVPRTSTEYIYINEASWNQIDPVESQGVGEPLAAMPAEASSPLEELVEKLPYCQDAEDLRLIAEGYPAELMEDAIALQDSQPLRQQLREWWELAQSSVNQIELSNRLSRCVNIPTFRQITEHFPDEEVRAAIERLSRVDRDRLLTYWREMQRQDEARVNSFAQRLLAAFQEGIEAFKGVLSALGVCDRWKAIEQFELLSPDKMQHLMQIEPNWFELCG